VNAPFLWPNSVEAAPSPCSVAQLTSTNSPVTWWRDFLSSNMRRARCDLPAPVGPVSRMGARERTATRSISSIIVLKRALRVGMPLLRKSSASVCAWSKRAASAS